MLKLQVIGNLGAGAEVKDFNGRKAVCFNVAHTERWTDESGTKHEQTVWVSCIQNGDGGSLLQYLKAGTKVFVIGSASTRVYSSPKERKMVAGLNLRVDHIELIGGLSDEVPHSLVDEAGSILTTHKAFFVSPKDLEPYKIPQGGCLNVSDISGRNRYQIAQEGWITPVRTNEDQDTVY